METTAADTILAPPMEPDAPALPTAEELTELANRAVHDARLKWDALWEEGQRYVKAHPGQAVMAALGAGLLLGLLLKK